MSSRFVAFGFGCGPRSGARGRLLRQSDGVEGLGATVEDLDADDHSLPEGPHLTVDALDRHSASLAHRAVDDRNDDAITSIHRIACFRGVGIEVGEPLAKEPAHTVRALGTAAGRS